MLDLHGSFVKWDDLRRTCILAVIYRACHWYWQCWQSSQDHIVSHSCSPPFNGTRWVAQEGVILSKCRILHDMTFWPQMSYYRGFSRKKASFNVKCHFAYTMKLHQYEITFFLLEKYAHNIKQYEVWEKYMLMCSPCHTLRKLKSIVF